MVEIFHESDRASRTTHTILETYSLHNLIKGQFLLWESRTLTKHTSPEGVIKSLGELLRPCAMITTNFLFSPHNTRLKFIKLRYHWKNLHHNDSTWEFENSKSVNFGTASVHKMKVPTAITFPDSGGWVRKWHFLGHSNPVICPDDGTCWRAGGSSGGPLTRRRD